MDLFTEDAFKTIVGVALQSIWKDTPSYEGVLITDPPTVNSYHFFGFLYSVKFSTKNVNRLGYKPWL